MRLGDALLFTLVYGEFVEIGGCWSGLRGIGQADTAVFANADLVLVEDEMRVGRAGDGIAEEDASIGVRAEDLVAENAGCRDECLIRAQPVEGTGAVVCREHVRALSQGAANQE